MTTTKRNGLHWRECTPLTIALEKSYACIKYQTYVKNKLKKSERKTKRWEKDTSADLQVVWKVFSHEENVLAHIDRST